MPPPQGTFNPLEGPGDYTVTSTVHSTSYPAISPLFIPPLGKSVFIAGASRGLGLAMAISFARAGASKIAIAARSNLTSMKSEVLAAASKANRTEPQILSVHLDIKSQKSVDDAAKIVEKEFGGLDILIINAGIFGAMKPIAESEPEEWWNTWDVNVKGPYLTTRAFLPLMLKGGDKTIIATSSCGAHLTLPGLSAYQTTKLAVVRLMQFVDAEYAEKGVVAFSIHPGNIPTDIVGGKEGLSDWMVPVFVDAPELPGDSLVFLTKEKRQWLGGRYINMTWDMPELMAKKDEIVKGDKLKLRLVI